MANKKLEILPDGTVRLYTTYDPTPVLRHNALIGKEGAQWAKDRGLRHAASIDIHDIIRGMTSNTDPDMVAFMIGNDRAAFRRLLKKNPHWSTGGKTQKGLILK